MDWLNSYTSNELYVPSWRIVTTYNRNGSVVVSRPAFPSLKAGERTRRQYSKNGVRTYKDFSYRPSSFYERTSFEGKISSPCSLVRYPGGSVSSETFIGTPGGPLPSCTLQAWYKYQVPENENRAVTECLNKVGDMKAQYLTTLAEMTKTVNHLADRVRDAADFLFHLRRKQFRKAFRILLGHNPSFRTPGKLWLEYNYAWKQLANDIYNLQEAAKAFSEKDLVMRFVREVTEDFAESRSDARSSDGRWTYDIEYKVDTSYKCIIYCAVNDSTLRKLNSWGVTNPAVTAWEIVPFSFVIDWLMPIGNYLEALSATHGLTFLTGSMTRRIKGSVSYSYTRATTDWISVGRGTAEGDYLSVARSPYASWPSPLPYVKSPWSTRNTASALALLSQLGR